VSWGLTHVSLDVSINDLIEDPQAIIRHDARYFDTKVDMSISGEIMSVEIIFSDPYYYPAFNVTSIFDLDSCLINFSLVFPFTGIDLHPDQISDLCFGCVGDMSHNFGIQIIDYNRKVTENKTEYSGVIRVDPYSFFGE
jgi:hypothetical protein